MLAKLIKYDLKWIYKLIIIFYALALIFSGLSRIFMSIDNSLLYTIVGQICNATAISMIISSLINCLMRSWVRFTRNVYGDESYLTHTLPVEKKDIYLAKILSAVISSLTTVVVAALCIFIMYYSKENIEALKAMLNMTADMYGTSTFELIVIILSILFLELLFILIIGYVGIILGHRSNKKKILKTVLWGFCLYMMTSFLSLVVLYIISLFDHSIKSIILSNTLESALMLKKMLIYGFAIYLIYNVAYFFFGKYLFNKGVNVD